MPWQVSKAVRGKEGVSLSLMAEACLGQPLDKSMQLSSWASRPLSQRQLTYAGEPLPFVHLLQPRKCLHCSKTSCTACIDVGDYQEESP